MSGLEFVLDDVKNCEFHPFAINEASNIFRSVQRHVSRHNEVVYFEALWLSRRKVFNCGCKSCRISLPSKDTQCVLI